MVFLFFLKLFFVLIIFVSPLSALTSYLVGIVKVDETKVYSQPITSNVYLVERYPLGTILLLDFCDQYDWCKLKGRNLFLSKITLGTMQTQEDPFALKQPIVNTDGKKNQLFDISKDVFGKENCIRLQYLSLDDKECISSAERDTIIAAYKNQCITTETIQAIFKDITKLCLDKGYITTHPYIQEQNIKDGTLQISIQKGMIEDIVFEDETRSDWGINTAFIFQKGKLLNIRSLETSLEMINRVPSVDAEFAIVPGSKEGMSIVRIKTQTTLPYRFAIGAIGEKDTYDSNPFLFAEVSFDNPFGINDILKLGYNGSRIQKDYQSSSGKELNYSFPIGSFLLEYIWFDFLYDQQIIGLNDVYVTSGETKGSTLKINKILHRNQNSKLETAFSLQYKNSKNYFSDQLLEVSSYKTTLAQLDFKYSYFTNIAQLYALYSFTKGTDWFGARSDADTQAMASQPNDAKLQFTKHNIDLNLFYFIPQSNFQMNSNFHLQHTNNFLYDNNKLRLGSFYSVRGYASSYYGNRGWYLRNDLSYSFYPNFDAKYIQSFTPYVGFDHGKVMCQKDNAEGCGNLTGYAVGAKTDGRNISFDITWSRAMKKIQDQKLESLFRYNLIFKF